MIKIEHLQKYFNRGKRSELHVLNDITLELPQTGLVCILGESGSGKTTLLNTIGGLDVFQGGTLTVDETILKKYEPKKIEHLRCEKFGYIFQNYYLLQDYTVAYNVKLALRESIVCIGAAWNRPLQKEAGIQIVGWTAAEGIYCPGTCEITADHIGR